jgi:hypothetical protein
VIKEQLDRIEACMAAVQADVASVKADVTVLRGRVGSVEKKASFWGALGGLLPAIVAHLGGCF